MKETYIYAFGYCEFGGWLKIYMIMDFGQKRMVVICSGLNLLVCGFKACKRTKPSWGEETKKQKID